MRAQQVHTIALFVSLLVSIFLVIAAAKYAAWSHVMVEGKSAWLSLVFYLGSMPVLSLTYATIYILLLHLDIIPSFSTEPQTSCEATVPAVASTALLILSILQLAGWLIQASLCTVCELGPVLAGHEGRVPEWCPQSQFRDRGKGSLPGMLATLAEAKDFAQWGMVLLGMVLAECARREWARGLAVGREKAKHGDMVYETGWMAGGNEAHAMTNLAKANLAKTGPGRPRAPLPRMEEDLNRRPGRPQAPLPRIEERRMCAPVPVRRLKAMVTKSSSADSPDSTGPHGLKRKAGDGSAAATPTGQRHTRSKRNRYISIACNECKRRKIKCNGQTPCHRCGNLNLDCVYAPNCCTNSLKDSAEFQQLKETITALQGQPGSGARTLPPLVSPKPRGPQRVLPAFVGPTSSAYGFNVAKSTLQTMGITNNTGLDDGTTSRERSQAASPTSVQSRGRGVYAQKDPLWLLQLADVQRLLDVYEEEIGITYPVYAMDKLAKHAALLYKFIDASRRQGFVQPLLPGADALDDDDSTVLKMVLACTLALEGGGRSELGQRFFDSAKPAVDLKLVTATGLVSVVQLVLTATYYFQTDEETQAWRFIGIAARVCIELGLHRRDSLLKTFTNEAEYQQALRIFWSVYALDRRWSFGTGMPFALQDADIDPALPEPDDTYPYLKHITKYNQIATKVWYHNVACESGQTPTKKDEIGFLDYQIVSWYQELPADLQFNRRELQRENEIPGRGRRRLRMLMHLRKNQARISIYRPILHSATSIMENRHHAQQVVDVAKETITTLTGVSQISDIYRTQQIMYHYFLVQALAVLFLAVAHAPAVFCNQTRQEFYAAIELIKGFSTKSHVSRRLLDPSMMSPDNTLQMTNELSNLFEMAGNFGNFNGAPGPDVYGASFATTDDGQVGMEMHGAPFQNEPEFSRIMNELNLSPPTVPALATGLDGLDLSSDYAAASPYDACPTPSSATYADMSQSSSQSPDSWIAQFCSLVGHEYFAEVSEDFIEDDFNLTGLQSQVSMYKEALEMILDSSAELLYGLIHARYITSRPGIQQMMEKYELAHFGYCPRVYCAGARVLPVGLTDTPGQQTVKLYCPSCLDVYTPPNSRFQAVDGAFFGTTFGCLFFMTFPDLDISPPKRRSMRDHAISAAAAAAAAAAATAEDTEAVMSHTEQNPAPITPSRSSSLTLPNAPPMPTLASAREENSSTAAAALAAATAALPPQPASINGVHTYNLGPGLGKGKIYEAKIYGFRVSERAKCGPRMKWLRSKALDVNELDEARIWHERYGGDPDPPERDADVNMAGAGTGKEREAKRRRNDKRSKENGGIGLLNAG
ncbi:hypothetical protein DV737_g4338, partial [Chaetothyriales sp. CBS 132003]